MVGLGDAGFEVRHSTPSLPVLWLQPATLSSWASEEEWDVIKAGRLCRAHSWVQLVPSWSSLNFCFHIIIVPFYKWRNATLRKQRGFPWGYTASWPFVWTKAHILTPQPPVLWILTQQHILWAKTKSKMSLGKQDSSCFLLVTWIPGISSHYSCLPWEFSGLLQCADVLLGRTCLSHFHSFSSPLGQPVFMKIGQGGGRGEYHYDLYHHLSGTNLNWFLWEENLL